MKKAKNIAVRREPLQRLVEGVDGILFSEALAADGAVVVRQGVRARPRRRRVEAERQLLPEREEPQLAQDQEPEFRQDLARLCKYERPLYCIAC